MFGFISPRGQSDTSDKVDLEESIPVVAMLGRASDSLVDSCWVCSLIASQFHAYEGHDLRTVTFPIRLFAKLGIRNLVCMYHSQECVSKAEHCLSVTNAAGSLNENIEVGTGAPWLERPVLYRTDF